MSEKHRTLLPPVGISSLLTILGVLCLTVFALLCLTTVRAGDRLSDQAARAVQDYCAADGRAEEILAALREGELLEGVERSGDVYAYSCPISNTQTLMVQVEVQGERYRILRWQAVSTADWQADDRLAVWTGE